MSLLKHEILQPVRHFNMHDDPLTNIETIHLVLWSKGLCIAGYDLDGKVLTAKVYHYSRWNIAAIESIFVNEPLVAGPQPVTHAWIGEERSMLIPQHLYTETAAIEWLQQFHFIEAGEQVKATRIAEKLNATVSYPVQDKLLQLLHKYFAEAKTDALSGMILCQDIVEGTATADLVFLAETTILTVYKQGSLQLHQISDNTSLPDLLYRMAAICQEFGIQQEELQLNLSGLCVTEGTWTELAHFFPKATLPADEQIASFTLLSKLISCAS